MTTQTQIETITVREVSPLGLRQIAEWMDKHYSERSWETLITPDDIRDAVHAWATDAENSQDGEIEMPARMTNSGRIVYLRPDMVTKEIVQ